MLSTMSLKNILFFILHLIILSNKKSLSQRDQRIFFPIIPFYRVQTVTPVPCVGIGPDNLEGTCNTLSRCKKAKLTSASPCQGNQGFCCIDVKYCEETSSSPVVYFRSPATTSETCSLTITKTNSSICQLRLDFIDFSLPQPVRGTCKDFLQLSVGESFLPKICGNNAGQHVYVEFLPNCADQRLSFKFQTSPTTSRNWNIKITQIPCNSPLAAPRGCLQYYTSLMGAVTSFNYGPAVTGVPRQLSPLNYNVCILPQYGYCSISWTDPTGTAFALQMPPTGSACENNYIAIPNPDCTQNCPSRNRFCGSNFTGATSSARIFELQVVNDYSKSAPDSLVGDTGFSLNFQQMSCT